MRLTRSLVGHPNPNPKIIKRETPEDRKGHFLYKIGTFRYSASNDDTEIIKRTSDPSLGPTDGPRSLACQRCRSKKVGCSFFKFSVFELINSIRLCSRDAVNKRAAVIDARATLPPAFTRLIIKNEYRVDIE